MRNLMCGLAVIGWVLSNPPGARAQRNALTQEEIDQGWILLFDGKTAAGWEIQGEGRVEDGVLVLGGDRPTRAAPRALLGRTFELRLEYRTDKGNWVPPKRGWNIPIEIGWETSEFLETAFHSGTLERQSRDENEWIEIIYTGEFDPANGRRSVRSRWRGAQEAVFVSRDQGSTTAAGGTRVIFEIPSGARLNLRNIKLKTEAVEAISPQMWIAVAVILGVLLAGLTAMMIRGRRRRLQTRTAPELPT